MDTNSQEFEIKGKGAEGRGVLTDKGFLVKAGSLARREIVPSAQSTVPVVHQRLISEGVLQEHGGQLRFTKDHAFDSPSGAAAAILGRTANGWIEWKLADGTTLSKVMRVTRDGQTSSVDEAQRQQILDRHQQLLDEGQVFTQQQVDEQYARFQERFGPSVLAGLDGEPLFI